MKSSEHFGSKLECDPLWTLAAIVEVDHADRIQCQCKGCGQTVFRRVHVILLPSGGIECWGSTCYERELGSHRGTVEPLYSSVQGRRLTEQEREWLKGNRDKLIAEFRAAKEQELAAIAERAARAKAAADRVAQQERFRLEAAARAFTQERETWTPDEPPRRNRQAVPPPQVRFGPEPMDDPLCREIRDKLAARWAAKRIDIERPGQKAMLLEDGLFGPLVPTGGPCHDF